MEESKKRKHQKKKKHHSKKHKRSSRSHRDDRSSSSSSRSSGRSPSASIPSAPSEAQWVEKAQPVHRDSWMLLSKPSSSALNEHEPKTEPQVVRQYNVALPPPNVLNVSSPFPSVPDGTTTTVATTAAKMGDGGSSWRRMKWKRVHEQAERENRTIEDVAQERYGSMEAYERERQALDLESEQSSRRSSLNSSRPTSGGGSVFRRPGQPTSRRSSQLQSPSDRRDVNRKAADDEKEKERELLLFQPPQVSRDVQIQQIGDGAYQKQGTGEYTHKGGEDQREVEGENNSGRWTLMEKEISSNRSAAQLLRDRLNSSAIGKAPDLSALETSQQQQSREPWKRLVGEDQMMQQEEDQMDVKSLLRKERLSSGADNNSMDKEWAQLIAKDGQFHADLDYMDEHADRLKADSKKAATKQKKPNASLANVHSRREQAELDRCWYCADEGRSPSVPLISVGVQFYLALPKHLPLMEGHCLLVPMQHHRSLLECDDSAWDEIRNFQKCLIRLFHDQGKQVVFMETHLQRHHAVMECLPVPSAVFDELPGCFKQALLEVADEWSQHRKIVETSRRGFRRCLVPNLAYFHVWFGLEEGYGHVIENRDTFPWYFGRETVGGLLDLSPDRWRRPRIKSEAEVDGDLKEFKRWFMPYDWTRQLS